MDFKFIHISDLHFGRAFPDTDSAPTLRHSIKHMTEIGKIVSKELKDLDRIIISGDISDSGDKESLLLARQWIRNSLEIGGGAKISLGVPEHEYNNLLRIIPGNHDAYNNFGVKKEMQLLYQKSLANYNSVFVEDKVEENGERYDWIEKKDRGVFIYYVDTSFLGDPVLENEKPEFKIFAKPAKGRFSIQKSERLLEIFDKGMNGSLKDNSNEEFIDKDKFKRALKIIVMHHYLFDPPGFLKEPFLEMSDKNSVFANIAMADFDILLCGHKHISDFRDERYIKHFDKRAKARYLLNYFRRILGIHSLPLQYADKKGKLIDRLKSFFISINIINRIQKNRSSDKLDMDLKFLEKFNELLMSGMANPDNFDYYIKKFIVTEKTKSFDEKELFELSKRIRIDLKKEDKEKLQKMCSNLQSMINSLSSRQFLQIMAGSACKNRSSKGNSFNIYEIEILDNGYRFYSRKYDSSGDKGVFLSPTPYVYEFTDLNRPFH